MSTLQWQLSALQTTVGQEVQMLETHTAQCDDHMQANLRLLTDMSENVRLCTVQNNARHTQVEVRCALCVVL